MGKDWDRLDGWRDGGTMTMTGIGERDIPWPSYGGETANPSCRACGGRQRGARRCACVQPDWHVGGEDYRPGDSARERSRRMQLWHYDWAVEAHRVLKPGGFLLAFGGTRTYHRLVCALEDAGFDIRDSIAWLYASGFPKSRNAAAAVDQHLGVQGSYDGVKPGHEDFVERTDAHSAGGRSDGWDRPWRDDEELVARSHQRYVPGSDDAATWGGWGTALKPSMEPIAVARKPLVGTIGRNLVEHGTGAINIDGCRVDYVDEVDQASATPQGRITTKGSGATGATPDAGRELERIEYGLHDNSRGRWPSNVVLSHAPDCVQTGSVSEVVGGGTAGSSGFVDGYERGSGFVGREVASSVWECVSGCPVALLDAQAGELRSGVPGTMRLGENSGTALGAESRPPGTPMTGYGDSGGASRFFPVFEWDHELDIPFCYQGKASRSERNAGLDNFEVRPLLWSSGEQNPGSFQSPGTERAARNPHPTVKPVDLMRWLVRLVTPSGAVVLDPFAGSGTTGVAAAIEGVRFIGIEREADFVEIARARIAHAHLVRDSVRAGRTRLRTAVKAPQGQDSLW